MLSFEVTNDGIQICCDQKGMDTLINALEALKADGDHIHLYSPSFMGRDLDAKTPGGDPAIGIVTISWFEE